MQKILLKKLTNRETITVTFAFLAIVAVFLFFYTLSQVEHQEYTYIGRVVPNTYSNSARTLPDNNYASFREYEYWNSDYIKAVPDAENQIVTVESYFNEEQLELFSFEFDYTTVLAESLASFDERVSILYNEDYGYFVVNTSYPEKGFEIKGFSQESSEYAEYFQFYMTGKEVNAVKIEDGLLIIHFEDNLTPIGANSTVIAIDIFTGEEVWRTHLSDRLQMENFGFYENSLPQYVYSLFVPTRSTLYELDLRTGEILKEREFSKNNYSQGLVYVWQDRLYYVQDQDTLVVESLFNGQADVIDLNTLVPDWGNIDFSGTIQYESTQGLLLIPERALDKQSQVAIGLRTVGNVDANTIPFLAE